MSNTITKFSRRFNHGKVLALAYGAGLLGVVAFFAMPYLVPIGGTTVRIAISAAVGLVIGCLVAIFGGSLFKKP